MARAESEYLNCLNLNLNAWLAPQAVRAAHGKALGEPHAAMNEIFHEVVQHKVQGYDQ